MPTDPPLPSYSWEQTFCDAILETDNSVLAGRLENARRALTDRHTAISDLPEPTVKSCAQSSRRFVG